MNINIISAVSIMGALNGFLIATFLILRRKSWINAPLIIYIIILSTYILGVSLKYLNISDLIFQYIYFNDILYGILIYMFVRNKIANSFILFKRDFFYIIPILLIYSLAHILSLQSGDVTLKWSIELVVNLFFVCIALKTLTSHIKKQDSIIQNKSLNKLKTLITICLIFDLLEVIIFVLYVINHSDIYLYLCLNTMYTITIYVIGYNELLFNHTQERERERETTITAENSGIKERLLLLMNEEKIYRNKGIKLSDIAELLGEKTSVISYIINNDIGKNFTEFINYYRVEDAKIMLSEKNSKLSIEGIGYEAGFKTKSTFYIAFKKITGKTPMKY